MKESLKIYLHTLKSDCKFAEDKEEARACDKVIRRLEDIIKNVKKNEIKKVIKSYMETLKIRCEEAETMSNKKFYSEIIRKLKVILKK